MVGEQVADGTSIDLVPAALLAQRDGFEAALRMAVAELLVAGAAGGRPAWVRVGAARYFSQAVAGAARRRLVTRTRCPSDAELTLAISAPRSATPRRAPKPASRASCESARTGGPCDRVFESSWFSVSRA